MKLTTKDVRTPENREFRMLHNRIGLFNTTCQDFKRYGIPKAQLILTDVPYSLGKDAYGSNPTWYVDGDNKKGESDKAGSSFFTTDENFKPAEMMHFAAQMLKPEPKESGKAPCMIIFCEFEQQFYLIELAKRYGLKNYINLVFRKNYSAQVLKANMRVVGNCEYGLILYRDKLPKFNNGGGMVFNCMDYPRELGMPRIHPCLPTGEKVFINNKWTNIENVKVGDCSKYGKVIETSSHFAEKIIEISTTNGTTKATWNHPFLVLRNNEIAWIHAEQINTNDKILWNVSINQPKKDTSGFLGMEKQEWNTLLSGKNILGKSQMGIKSTTLTATKQIITLKTSDLLRPLNISGYTKVASISTENGTNLALCAENTSHATKASGIIREVVLAEEFVKNVMPRKSQTTIDFELQTVGSVKIIDEKTKVHNLTIDGVPAFDTLIGCSHNTQKSIPLLKKLIKLFTDVDDVVIDPFAGSASTLIAAASLGRKAYGMEISKRFYLDACDALRTQIQPDLFNQSVELEKRKQYTQQKLFNE